VGKNTGWRCEPAFFAYFPCGGKESKCRPAQGQRWQTENTTRMPAKQPPEHQNTRTPEHQNTRTPEKPKTKNQKPKKKKPSLDTTAPFKHAGGNNCPLQAKKQP
jgi:hypothetical protein